MRRPRAGRLATRATIAQYCKQLSWSQTAVSLCEQATPTQERFLEHVMAAELAHREVSRRARLLSRAGFPAHKTLAEFQRDVVQLPSTLRWSDLETGTFIAAHRNLVCYGGVGLGKTHLSIALGVAACERGWRVPFFTATGLVVRLTEARQAGLLERLFAELQRTDLLIVDEWGYLPIDREGAQLLFRVVADSYETRSLIITTNLEFSQWGGIFADDQMTAAMIDRLAHHGHLLVFEGESYRMQHALMKER
ncbi:MAG: IS21-like element helper ATPase IstB [Firmicutes bacterium]|nr:IS21-like element helper ATPase IstB [Bacillota bacterium]